MYTPVVSFFKININRSDFHHIFITLVDFDCRLLTWPSFSNRSRDVAMATNFKGKMGETGRLTFIRRLGIPKRCRIYRNSDFKRFICDDMATLCINLVNFSSVTPEFKRVKGVHPLVDQRFAMRRHCYPSVSVASFMGRSVLSFVPVIRFGASLLCRAGYTLGSAAHF